MAYRAKVKVDYCDNRYAPRTFTYLEDGKTTTHSLKPDYLLKINGREIPLEIDRKTERGDVLIDKAKNYCIYEKYCVNNNLRGLIVSKKMVFDLRNVYGGVR